MARSISTATAADLPNTKCNIIDGTADTVYCAVGQTEPECETTDIDALSGNKVGGTGHGIADRLNAEPTTGCSKDGDSVDDFDEVFAPNSTALSQYIVVCPESPRVIIVPIVTLNGDPVKTVTIQGWALAYLNGYRCVGDANLHRRRGTGKSISPWLTPSTPRPPASSEHSTHCRTWPSAASSSNDSS